MTVADQIIEVQRQVAEAADPYQARWTLRALQLVDRDLYDLLEEQRGLYETALITGTAQEMADQAGGMCRGWQAAVRRMEEAKAPDDAYQLGQCTKTGVKVAIGEANLPAERRVREMHGNATTWLTPDEVAIMFAGLDLLRRVKGAFPGAQITETTWPQEAAKGD